MGGSAYLRERDKKLALSMGSTMLSGDSEESQTHLPKE